VAERGKEHLVATKGFFILPSQLFENIKKKAATEHNLSETLERIFKSIEASAQVTRSEDSFKGLFEDLDVNSNKLAIENVKNLMANDIKRTTMSVSPFA
jgi:type I restriction enzyme M protein